MDCIYINGMPLEASTGKQYTKIRRSNRTYYVRNEHVKVCTEELSARWLDTILLAMSEFAIEGNTLIKCRYSVEDIVDTHINSEDQ